MKYRAVIEIFNQYRPIIYVHRNLTNSQCAKFADNWYTPVSANSAISGNIREYEWLNEMYR